VCVILENGELQRARAELFARVVGRTILSRFFCDNSTHRNNIPMDYRRSPLRVLVIVNVTTPTTRRGIPSQHHPPKTRTSRKATPELAVHLPKNPLLPLRARCALDAAAPRGYSIAKKGSWERYQHSVMVGARRSDSSTLHRTTQRRR
jgi:hypothetical protein